MKVSYKWRKCTWNDGYKSHGEAFSQHKVWDCRSHGMWRALDEWLSTFDTRVAPSSSKVKQPNNMFWPLKVKALLSFEVCLVISQKTLSLAVPLCLPQIPRNICFQGRSCMLWTRFCKADWTGLWWRENLVSRFLGVREYFNYYL